MYTVKPSTPAVRSNCDASVGCSLFCYDDSSNVPQLFFQTGPVPVDMPVFDGIDADLEHSRDNRHRVVYVTSDKADTVALSATRSRHKMHSSPRTNCNKSELDIEQQNTHL